MTNTAHTEYDPEITLGWRLRISMERAGIKADDMAARMGVHRGTITRWTHDIGKPPRQVYLEKWAELTRVRVDWLKGGGDSGQATGRETEQYPQPIAA